MFVEASKLALTRLRQAVQFASAVVFAVLTVAGLAAWVPWMPEHLFSRLDPLVAVAAVLASRTVIAFWVTALLTVALTIVFGRAWCGWICPVGTLLDVLPAPSRKRPGGWRAWIRTPAWRLGKYVALAVVLGAALLGSLSPMVLDPVTILTRPLQELARPFAGTDGVGMNAGTYIARESFRGIALLSLLPLTAVLALNAFGRRTWCRTLCPLGALLALVSVLPGIRRRVDAEACTGCARCERVCPTLAIRRDDAFASDPGECAMCMRCADECPSSAIAFRAGRLLQGYRPERREALAALAAGSASLAVAALPLRAEGALLRPPATDERRLAELCVRCGACYSACPTGVLRPSLSLLSPAGLWTPMLDERPAHCTLNCNRCATVCPTDAIHTLTTWEKLAEGVGAVARVDKARCRAWGRGKECMLCRGACPISGALLQTETVGRGGDLIGAPAVDIDLCVGCGQCSLACPEHPPAILVPR